MRLNVILSALVLACLLNVKGCHLWAAPPVPTSETSFVWDPLPTINQGGLVAGYKIWIGYAPGIYTNAVDAGLNTHGIVSNLVVGATYYFSVTSYNIFYTESLRSPPLRHVVGQSTASIQLKFQMEVSGSPVTGWVDVPGAVITVTNVYNPLTPGYFYRTKIIETVLP